MINAFISGAINGIQYGVTACVMLLVILVALTVIGFLAELFK